MKTNFLRASRASFGNRHWTMLPALISAATVLAAGLLAAPAAQAQSLMKKAESVEYFDFNDIQEKCVRTVEANFGEDGRWKDCRLERAGFVATIGLQDFYFAEYCLIKSGSKCDRQAQLVFSNRAYRPEAVLRLQRIDAAGTRYENPLVTGDAGQDILVTTVKLPRAKMAERTYYTWAGRDWSLVDVQSWRSDLKKMLPEGVGTRLAAGALPDPVTLEMSVPLYREADRDCCASAGKAEVRFVVEGQRLAVAEVTRDVR